MIHNVKVNLWTLPHSVFNRTIIVPFPSGISGSQLLCVMVFSFKNK